MVVLLLTGSSRAEEGGTGHYLPGSMSSFIDASPTAGALGLKLNAVYYNGSFGLEPTPIAGVTAIDLKAESYALGLVGFWSPKLDLPENWSYAAAITVPYVWLEVSGDVITGNAQGRRSDSIDGIGDILVFPAMITYQATPDFKIDGRLGIYVPTGDYEVGRLANTGKNYWTFEPTIGLYYFGKKNGIEATLIAGIDFNTENSDTSYKTGTQARMEGTIAQHFPLFGGFGGAGATGFWYEQIEGDSGDGAILGDFKGRSAGAGPVLSWAGKLGDVETVLEAKWLHEFETRNRLEGDYVWLKLVLKF
jgi:hypothetical protein